MSLSSSQRLQKSEGLSRLLPAFLPLLGYFFLGWDGSEILFYYYTETLLMTALLGLLFLGLLAIRPGLGKGLMLGFLLLVYPMALFAFLFVLPTVLSLVYLLALGLDPELDRLVNQMKFRDMDFPLFMINYFLGHISSTFLLSWQGWAELLTVLVPEALFLYRVGKEVVAFEELKPLLQQHYKRWSIAFFTLFLGAMLAGITKNLALGLAVFTIGHLQLAKLSSTTAQAEG